MTFSPETLRTKTEKVQRKETRREQKAQKTAEQVRRREELDYVIEHGQRIADNVKVAAGEAAANGKASASYRERSSVDDAHKVIFAFKEVGTWFENAGFGVSHKIESDSRIRYDAEPTPATYCENVLQISWQDSPKA